MNIRTRADRQADVRMDIDRPDAAERDQPGERLAREAHQEQRQVDQPHRVDRVDRMLAMGGEPIEMLGRVMHGVEPPEEGVAMLQPMAPVDEEVAEHDDLDGLQPPGLPGHRAAKRRRHDLPARRRRTA